MTAGEGRDVVPDDVSVAVPDGDIPGGDTPGGDAPGGGLVAIRLLLMILGVAVGLYGASLLWQNPPVIIVRILVWAGAGVVLHDVVFAPACVALGFAGRRLIPRTWWGPVGVAALCSAVLGLLAIPVFDRPGAHADNLTVLDRDYPRGLGIALAIVWAGVLVYLIADRFLPPGGRRDRTATRRSRSGSSRPRRR
jgi:hypothetical protein